MFKYYTVNLKFLILCNIFLTEKKTDKSPQNCNVSSNSIFSSIKYLFSVYVKINSLKYIEFLKYVICDSLGKFYRYILVTQSYTLQ